MITRTLPRNAPRFEKPGFDPPHCHTLASLPAKPTFILQHNCVFQAQFLPQRLFSASLFHNHLKTSAAVLCHAKTPAPTLNWTVFHPRLAHAPTPAFAKHFVGNPTCRAAGALPVKPSFHAQLGMCQPAFVWCAAGGSTLTFTHQPARRSLAPRPSKIPCVNSPPFARSQQFKTRRRSFSCKRTLTKA